MSEKLKDKSIAFLVANEGIERVELTEPWEEIGRNGGTPVLIAPEAGSAQAFDHLTATEEFNVDRTVADADPGEFDGLVLPGGVANPDALRLDDDAVAFVRAFFEAPKPVAAICHAPWMLVEAEVVEGRRLTSWPSLRTDIRNAGGTWVDAPVVVDRGLVTSRKPDDLEAFCTNLIEVFGEGVHEDSEQPSLV